MLHTKKGLVGLATVLISSALVAASSSSTLPSTTTSVIDSAILIPCGSAGEKAHPVVPDANGCQPISSSGAFVVNQLPILPDGIAIGFAADPTCSKTYTPSYEELVSLRDGEQCTVYYLDQSSRGVIGRTNGMGPKQPPGNRKRSIADEGPVVAQPGGAGGTDPKWNHLVMKKRDNNAGAPVDNQIPLKYVMIVNA